MEWQCRSGVSPVERPNHHCTGVKGVEGHTHLPCACVLLCRCCMNSLVWIIVSIPLNSLLNVTFKHRDLSMCVCLHACVCKSSAGTKYTLPTTLSLLWEGLRDDTSGWNRFNIKLNWNSFSIYMFRGFSFGVELI